MKKSWLHYLRRQNTDIITVQGKGVKKGHKRPVYWSTFKQPYYPFLAAIKARDSGLTCGSVKAKTKIIKDYNLNVAKTTLFRLIVLIRLLTCVSGS